MSMKKDIIKLNVLRGITFALDNLLYSFALESNEDIKIGNEKLTFYMQRIIAPYIMSDDFNEYVKRKKNNIELILNSFTLAEDTLTSKVAIDYLYELIAGWEVSQFFYESNKKPDILIKAFKNTHKLIFKVKILLLYLPVNIYGNFRYTAIHKVWSHRKN